VIMAVLLWIPYLKTRVADKMLVSGLEMKTKTLTPASGDQDHTPRFLELQILIKSLHSSPSGGIGNDK